MFPSIDLLATRIASDWARANWDESALSDIACEHLDQPLDLDFETLARGIFSGATLPEQRRVDEGFGQPSLTLYSGERFQIEALCWHSGTPAIHQHAFSGAFRILTGQSVQTRYSFAAREKVGRVVLGDLEIDHLELLDARSVVPISRGGRFIHAAFHLDNPSMTLVVRTHQGSEPEPTYLSPGVSYDPAARSQALHKRLQLLDTLSRTSHPAYLDCVHAAVENVDLYDGMAMVMRAAGHQIDQETFLSLTQHLEKVHGPRITPVIAALIEERRRITIVHLRSSVTDSETRFFLAVLMSFSDKAHAVRAMAERYANPGLAQDRMATGIATLLGGDAPRQVVSTALAKAMLENVRPEEICAWAARMWNRSLSAGEADGIERYYGQILRHPVLAPLAAATRLRTESRGTAARTCLQQGSREEP